MKLYWDAMEAALGWVLLGAAGGAVVGASAALVWGAACCMLTAGAAVGGLVGVLSWTIMKLMKISPTERAVLVTGCDTGFGHALALHLEKLGFTVFAGCLDVEGAGAASLKKRNSKRLHVLAMDVTNDAHITQAERYVTKNLPKNGLWGIVNNAGVANFGEVEWVSLATYSKTLDVNVLGMIRVCKAFLPLLRKTKGRVVNMASGLDRMTVPLRSAYVLSKYAVAGYTDCLRQEMKSWGVKVSIIEPGNYIAGTGIFTTAGIDHQAKVLWASMSDSVKAEYGRRHFEARVKQMRGYCSTGIADVTPVVDSFTSALMDRVPQAQYQPMNLYFKVRYNVAVHCPAWFYDLLYVTTLTR